MAELVGKEVINLTNGARLGVVGDSDLAIDVRSGQVQALILPRRAGLTGWWTKTGALVIPWEAVRKIGNQVIIVELEPSSPRNAT
jgi:YlmC/YmxH family sporulation protein